MSERGCTTLPPSTPMFGWCSAGARSER
ncbi:MAG: hypothetical protein QOF66_3070, partial [Mycobacterium sp.]|nr:hypothetical protein [Mycobacterium sp.]MDT5054704.1 hypothetical protein [Mycobacterium sp.]